MDGEGAVERQLSATVAFHAPDVMAVNHGLKITGRHGC